MVEVIELTIYANLIPFMCLVVLLPLIKGNHLFDRKQGRRFAATTIINIVMLVVISAGYVFESATFDSAWIFRTATTYLNFLASPLIPLFLYKIFTHEHHKAIFYLPLVINTIICTHSIFWGSVFRISQTNSYGRGPLFFVPFITSIFYVLAIIIRTKSNNRRQKRAEVVFLWAVVFVLVMCLFLEVNGGFRFLTWDSVAIMLTLYYLLLNINNARCDPMTGAFNRAMYNKALSDIENGRQEHVIAVVDLNNFKQINDKFGHEAGDKCLIALVSLLQAHCGDDAVVYRIGGDEFAIISSKWSVDGIVAEMETMLKTANESDIDFAYGVSLCRPGESSEAAIFIADKNMYIHKSAKKAANATE